MLKRPLLLLAIAAATAVTGAAPAHAATLTVTTTADDATPNDGTVSLREAITSLNQATTLGDTDISNQNPGTYGSNDMIHFNLPGQGRKVIQVGSAGGTSLPVISTFMTIDATSQAGYDGVPLIALDGTATGPNAIGLQVGSGASNSVIKGFDVFSFRGAQLAVAGALGAHLQANYAGFDSAGGQVTSGRGILIDFASDATIGGTSAADRNVISGNGAEWIAIGTTTENIVVKGNYIGTDVTGAAAVANALATPSGSRPAAVHLFGDHTLIGGTDAGAGNVISGNAAGIVIEGGQSNEVLGNRIGTDASGANALPNSADGVLIVDNPSPRAAQNNRVGGKDPAAANTIAFNGGDGVEVSGSADTTRNAIEGNSIHDNGALGIDLGGNGVSQNTADTDTGPNSLQSFPTISAQDSGAGSTTVRGDLGAANQATYRVELFDAGTCDASGNGEGKTFLTATDVTTNALGSGSFTVDITPALPVGAAVTATTTDAFGNTSEFSACATVQAASTGNPPPPAPVLTKFTQSAKRWRLGNALPKAAAKKRRPPVGTTFRFELNVPAQARLAFKRKVKGKFRSAGALKLSAHAGKNKLRFTGRLTQKRKLKPGLYRVTITATDSTQRKSAPHSLTFRVLKHGARA